MGELGGIIQSSLDQRNSEVSSSLALCVAAEYPHCDIENVRFTLLGMFPYSRELLTGRSVEFVYFVVKHYDFPTSAMLSDLCPRGALPPSACNRELSERPAACSRTTVVH